MSRSSAGALCASSVAAASSVITTGLISGPRSTFRQGAGAEMNRFSNPSSARYLHAHQRVPLAGGQAIGTRPVHLDGKCLANDSNKSGGSPPWTHFELLLSMLQRCSRAFFRPWCTESVEALNLYER